MKLESAQSPLGLLGILLVGHVGERRLLRSGLRDTRSSHLLAKLGLFAVLPDESIPEHEEQRKLDTVGDKE